MNLTEAIQHAKLECKDPYAQTYLRAIPQAIDLGGTEGLHDQILYAIGNMRSWKGPLARECKDVMRKFLKR